MSMSTNVTSLPPPVSFSPPLPYAPPLSQIEGAPNPQNESASKIAVEVEAPAPQNNLQNAPQNAPNIERQNDIKRVAVQVTFLSAGIITAVGLANYGYEEAADSVLLSVTVVVNFIMGEHLETRKGMLLSIAGGLGFSLFGGLAAMAIKTSSRVLNIFTGIAAAIPSATLSTVASQPKAVKRLLPG